MVSAQTLRNMSPKLLRVVERARREPRAKFHSLAHLIDVEALKRAYARQRKNAAVGVDGITKEEYGSSLEENLHKLHDRLKTKRYRHQPIRRVHIPKGKGKTRPIGVAAFEDKLVQDAVREVLEAVYEQDFLDCSYGFRPGRSAHDAVKTLDQVLTRGQVNWILEADIVSFFDSLDRKRLKEMLRERVLDGSMGRLVGKCLHVGILDGVEISTPKQGTVQGSVLSPLLGNVYLHYVLDLWFERIVKPRMRGRVILIRYCDDFVIGFERQDDARRVYAVLGKRMAKFGLALHADKTRLVPFQRPSRAQTGGRGPGTFDFLGFTFYWTRSRKGFWRPALKTRHVRLQQAIRRVYEWCRLHRHLPVPEQHVALVRRIRGHFQYFGVNGNTRCLGHVYYHAQRAWYKWLCRRSQRTRLTWDRFADLLRDFPLPIPRVYVRLWGSTP